MGSKAIITEDTDLDPRVLKRHYVELKGSKWEISTAQLIENPENPAEVLTVFSDMFDDIHWKYETMIFRIDNEERFNIAKAGAWSFGHYRSNESKDIVKAHEQIVALIAEGKLKPQPIPEEQHRLQISANIIKAMMAADEE